MGATSELVVYAGLGHADYHFAALSQERAQLVADITAFVRHCP